jgi:catechol 2,3-dioxygenase-like lactoylglutathione lyase family enzyme
VSEGDTASVSWLAHGLVRRYLEIGGHEEDLHVECFVPDRYEAAEWYERVLGLTIVPEYEYWANDPDGPLMISSDGGNTKLALFEDRDLSAEHGGYDQVAFRVNGPGFVAFVARLEELTLLDRTGERVSSDSVRDHQGAYSLYFVDPWSHRLEVTTYDCEYVSAHL